MWNFNVIPKWWYIIIQSIYEKSNKMPYTIYANLEFLVKKIDEFANNAAKYSTAKIDEDIPCGYSMSNK